MAENLPIYLNWSFWAAIAAFLAIVLSQAPPVWTWFKGARLSLEIYSKIALTHKFGNPNAQLQLILTNVGGGSVRIRSIALKFSRVEEYLFELSGQNYLQEAKDKESVLLIPFSLKPDESWGHITNFFNDFDRNTEREVRRFKQNLSRDIGQKVDARIGDELVSGSPELVQPFLDLFSERFQ